MVKTYFSKLRAGTFQTAILCAGIIFSIIYPSSYNTANAYTLPGCTINKNLDGIYCPLKTGIDILGIDDIPEEHTTEIKVPGKTVITKLIPSKNSIKIKWKKASHCQGYIISRSLKKHSGYNEIANIKNSSQTSYIDKNLKPGKKYYYYIHAYSSKDNITVYGKDSKNVGVKTKK